MRNSSKRAVIISEGPGQWLPQMFLNGDMKPVDIVVDYIEKLGLKVSGCKSE